MIRKKTIHIPLPDINNSFYIYKPYAHYELNKFLIFVFGSNLKGVHGASAAKHASLYHHAVYGIGEGIQGGSYAIPTKDKNIKTLSLDKIKIHVDRFIDYNRSTNLPFFVTAIGTGLAGYKHSQIAPMFKGARRCWFPKEWEKYLKDKDE